jgi:hypothetical protein
MITQRQLDLIALRARATPVSEQIVELLRSSFSDIHFTYCMDGDVVAARPVYQDKAFNLYLIDSRDHCLCFTQDMDVATGVVLAELEGD